MTHDQIIELLPWYANETLEEGERRAVAEHLETCASCRRELKEFRIFASAEADASQAMPELPEGMLERTLERIDALEARPAPGPGERFQLWLQDWWTPTPGFTRAVLAAQLALIVGLLGWQLARGPDDGITTLSGGGETPAASVSFQVRFAEDAPEAAIRSAIRGVDGSIVAGPSALGVYTIGLPLDSEDGAAIDAAVEALRQSAAVTYVERAP